MIWIGIIFVLSIMFLGLVGGQGKLGKWNVGKGTRRFGIPGLAFLASLFNWHWRNLAILLFIPALIVGYGENSGLMGVFKFDFLVRVIYALILSVPFLFTGLKRWVISAILLVIVFQIRAGVLFSVGTFEVLIEDIFRYSALGILIFFNFLLRKA